MCFDIYIVGKREFFILFYSLFIYCAVLNIKYILWHLFTLFAIPVKKSKKSVRHSGHSPFRTLPIFIVAVMKLWNAAAVLIDTVRKSS